MVCVYSAAGLRCDTAPPTGVSGMPSDVEYSPVGEGLGMRDFWLYVWLRRAAAIAAHFSGLSLTIIIALMSRPGTSESVSFLPCFLLTFTVCRIFYITAPGIAFFKLYFFLKKASYSIPVKAVQSPSLSLSNQSTCPLP